MVSLTNGIKTKGWIELSRDWNICAYLSTDFIGQLTVGMKSKGIDSRNRGIDIIRDTVYNRREELRELAKY